MKYQCNTCKKVFIHPAKLNIVRKLSKINDKTESVGSFCYQEIKEIPLETIERYVCPFCDSLTFSEFQEPEESITSVKSVSLEEVDGWLLQGYVVRELYAKTATLVKLEKPKGADII